MVRAKKLKPLPKPNAVSSSPPAATGAAAVKPTSATTEVKPTPAPVAAAPDNTGGTKVWLFVGLGVVILALLGVGLYFAFKPKPARTTSGAAATTTTTTTTTTGGGGGGGRQAAATTRYPLQPLMNNNDQGYQVQASSSHSCSITASSGVMSGQPLCREPFYVFNGIPELIWHSVWNDNTKNYIGTSGRYQGTTSTTTSETNVLGEWIQLRLPYPSAIQLTAFTITPRQDSPSRYIPRRCPRDFIVAASNDGVNWTTVYTATNVTNWTTAPQTFTLDAPTPIAYRYFRLIVTRVGTMDNDTNIIPDTSHVQNSIQISDLKFFGIPANGSAVDASVSPAQQSLLKTQQISGSACIQPNVEFKAGRPLTASQLADTTYTYGLTKYDSGLDGVFVKAGCRGRFLTRPGNQDVYCSSWDLTDEYCRPQGEVFQVTRSGDKFTRAEAENICSVYNSELATLKQLRTALQQKGMWCEGGWLRDDTTNVYNPYLTGETDKAGQSCGTTTAKVFYDYLAGGIDVAPAPTNGKAAVNCYGVRPSQPVDNHQLVDFSKEKPSMYTPSPELFQVADNTHRYFFKESEAASVCAKYGASLASKADLVTAYNNGYSVCQAGWLQNVPGESGAWFAVNAADARTGCVTGLNNWTPTKEWVAANQPTLTGVNESRATVFCVGNKPPIGKDNDKILPRIDTDARYRYYK